MDQRLTQYGNILEIPRTHDTGKVVTRAMQWILQDFTSAMREIGVDPEKVRDVLQVFYVDPVEGAGQGSHSDPLAQRKFPMIRDSHLVGWKIALEFEGDPPGEPLTEGVAPKVRRG